MNGSIIAFERHFINNEIFINAFNAHKGLKWQWYSQGVLIKALCLEYICNKRAPRQKLFLQRKTWNDSYNYHEDKFTRALSYQHTDEHDA